MNRSFWRNLLFLIPFVPLLLAGSCTKLDITLTQKNLSVEKGAGTKTITVNIVRENVNGVVDLTATGAPTGVNISFDPSSTTGNTSIMNITVTSTAAVGSSAVMINGITPGLNANTPLALTITSTNVFVQENAWTEPLPDNAKLVTPEEFQRRFDLGETQLVSTASRAAQKGAIDQQFRDDKTFLQTLSNQPLYVKQLLEQVASSSTFIDDQTLIRPDGQSVVVLGLGSQLHDAVETIRSSQTASNALSVYNLSYALLPDNLKSQAQIPENLKGQSLEQIQTALHQINQLLGTASAAKLLNLARLETNSRSQPRIIPTPGSGTDNNGACTSTNYFARYWFPLKKFVSPIKDQARRGVCWVFAAIGAVESRERVQNDNPIDLSEQFLINKVKREWFPDDMVEGGSPDSALNAAKDRGLQIPVETVWTYNPSRSRIAPTKTAPVYSNSCISYNSPSCSDSAHQSTLMCTTTSNVKYCVYDTMTLTSPSVASSNTKPLWLHGKSFDLNGYRLLLNQGYVLLASFPVYSGFLDLPASAKGVVSDYRAVHIGETGTEVGGSYGDHVVQIVGFLSNEELAAHGDPVVGGGGLFIIKNSWGCAAGDGGYYYIPADYVSSRFNHLSVLDFDNRRSPEWNRNEVPVISSLPGNSAREPGQYSIILNTAPSLTGAYDVVNANDYEDFGNLTLTANSSIDGDFTPIAGGVTKTLSVGLHQIEIKVADSKGAFAEGVYFLNVIAKPPTLTVTPSATTVQQGVGFLANALGTYYDQNSGTTRTLPCDNIAWSVTAPDVVKSSGGTESQTATGCDVVMRFLTQGSRAVSVTGTGLTGGITTKGFTVDVTAPPLVLPPDVGPITLRCNGAVPIIDPVSGLPLCRTINEANGLPSVVRARVDATDPNGKTLIYTWTIEPRESGFDAPVSLLEDLAVIIDPNANHYSAVTTPSKLGVIERNPSWIFLTTNTCGSKFKVTVSNGEASTSRTVEIGCIVPPR
jgi:C1A family cysteine protease